MLLLRISFGREGSLDELVVSGYALLSDFANTDTMRRQMIVGVGNNISC